MKYYIVTTLLCCLPAAAGEFYDGPSLPASCWKSVDCLMDKGGMGLQRGDQITKKRPAGEQCQTTRINAIIRNSTNSFFTLYKYQQLGL